MKNKYRRTVKNSLKDKNLKIYFMKSFLYSTFLLSMLLFLSCGESVNKSENTAITLEEKVIEISKAQLEGRKCNLVNYQSNPFLLWFKARE